jgi:hypothetical protein
MALNLIVIVPVNTAGGEYQLIPVTSIAMPVQYTSLSFLSQPLVSSSHNLECVHKETDVGRPIHAFAELSGKDTHQFSGSVCSHNGTSAATSRYCVKPPNYPCSSSGSNGFALLPTRAFSGSDFHHTCSSHEQQRQQHEHEDLLRRIPSTLHESLKAFFGTSTGVGASNASFNVGGTPTSNSGFLPNVDPAVLVASARSGSPSVLQQQKHQQMVRRVHGCHDEPSSSSCLGAKCSHVQSWKRLRVKQGLVYYTCRQCGVNWRIPSNRCFSGVRRKRPLKCPNVYGGARDLRSTLAGSPNPNSACLSPPELIPAKPNSLLWSPATGNEHKSCEVDLLCEEVSAPIGDAFIHTLLHRHSQLPPPPIFTASWCVQTTTPPPITIFLRFCLPPFPSFLCLLPHLEKLSCQRR